MMKPVEARGAGVNNACPLRSAIIPQHFRLDTSSLIHLCTRHAARVHEEWQPRPAPSRDRFFKTEKKCFHNAHTFDHQIETDGVSCSILLKRRDVVGKRAKEFVEGDAKDQTKFRYTQDQRRKETKATKYRDYLQERKQETVDG